MRLHLAWNFKLRATKTKPECPMLLYYYFLLLLFSTAPHQPKEGYYEGWGWKTGGGSVRVCVGVCMCVCVIVTTVTFWRKKNVLLSPQFRKVRWQIPQSFLFSLFLPNHYLNLHSCHSRTSFIFCWFHQDHPTKSAKNTTGTISRRRMIFLMA